MIKDTNAYVGRATPQLATDLARLYWTTTTPLDELHARFGEGTGKSHLYRKAGAATMDVACADCKALAVVTSRSLAVQVIYTGRTPYRCSECYSAERRRLDAARMRKWKEDAERAETLRWMPYPEFLGSDEWAKRRRAALIRAEFKCQVCASDGKLHVHHRTYARRGSERPADLTVLCAGCHELFHRNGKLAEQGRAA